MTDQDKFLSVQIPQFEGKKIRMGLTEGGDPLFHMTDVYTALEYENPKGSASNFRTTLDEKQMATYTVFTGHSAGVHSRCTLNFTPNARGEFLLTEAGLWVVFLRCTKPVGKRLEMFVASEVMPQIHRTGSYGPPPVDVETLSLEGHMQLAKSAIALVERLQREQALVRIQRVEIVEKDRVIETQGAQIRNMTFGEKWIGIVAAANGTTLRECDVKMFIYGQKLGRMLNIGRKRRLVPMAGMEKYLRWGVKPLGQEEVRDVPTSFVPNRDTLPDQCPSLWIYRDVVDQLREYLGKTGRPANRDMSVLFYRAKDKWSTKDMRHTFFDHWQRVAERVGMNLVGGVKPKPSAALSGRKTRQALSNHHNLPN